MHILAALTDGPIANMPPAKGEAAKDQSDFETAFLALSEEALVETGEASDELPQDVLPEDTVDAADATTDGETDAQGQPDDVAEVEPELMGRDPKAQDDPVDAVLRQGANSDRVTKAEAHPQEVLSMAIARPKFDPQLEAQSLTAQQSVPLNNARTGEPAQGLQATPVSPLQSGAPVVLSALVDPKLQPHDIPIEGRFALERPAQAQQTLPPAAQQVKMAIPLAAAAAQLATEGKAVLSQAHSEKGKARDVFADMSVRSEGSQAQQPLVTQNAPAPVVPAILQSPIAPSAGLALETTSGADLSTKAEEGPSLAPIGRTETTSMPQPMVTSQANHPQLAQHIARQMAEALKAGSDGPVDVALSPEELGKVRMRITLQDGGIMIHILAERAETLDLMRKNADQLGQEFEGMGFGSVDFGFASSEDSATDQDDQQTSGRTTGTQADGPDQTGTAVLPITNANMNVTQGVDIRL